MKFRSIMDPVKLYSAKEAVVRGLAPDGSLFVPASIPKLPADFFNRLAGMSITEIGFNVAHCFFGEELPEKDLRGVIDRACNFDAALRKLDDQISVLELFHGPTLAFKDFGARFMAELLGYFKRQDETSLTILVATSGDTGSAVASGFYNVPGIKVVVLYPSGKISPIQEQQITTLGGNISALEVEGTFDDCQRLVKEAFKDSKLSTRVGLTSANSINISRLVPQVFYYFRALAQLPELQSKIIVSVPSGNFGNLTAGLIAKQMGLPIEHFVAATNANDVFVQYLATGEFKPRSSVLTLSNSMDVGNPSNLPRIQYLYSNDLAKIRADVETYSFSDKETQAAISEAFAKSKYILDPHGAVAYLGLKKALQKHATAQGIFLETAHPAKFPEALPANVHSQVKMPERLTQYLNLEKKSIRVAARLSEIVKYL